MASLALATLAVVTFALALWRSGVARLFGSLTSETFAGVSAMFNSDLVDDEKERVIRKAGLQLLIGAWGIVWRFALAFASMFLPILLAQILGISSVSATLSVLLRLDFIVIISIASILLVWSISKLKGKSEEEPSIDSAKDLGNNLVHTFAFASPAVLRLLSKADDRIFAEAIEKLQVTPPILITSLARGGTTALLNAMHDLPGVATHLYRDMPFITAPLLWSKMSSKRRNVERRQRAHGDGLEIDLDSPEAFDEILWMLHWPEKYLDDGILPWRTADAKSKAQLDFVRHFKKISLLRRPERINQTEGGVRYLSKNNANISRLGLLPEMFPGCDIVVPIRHPASHAASLLRQHTNFIKKHSEDAFARQYMRDVGHFEFGDLHKPILFDQNRSNGLLPDSPDYWISYWIASFKEVLEHASAVHIVSQDDLRMSPDSTMNSLLERLNVPSSRPYSQYFHNIPDSRPVQLYSDSLMEEAESIFNELLAFSVKAGD